MPKRAGIVLAVMGAVLMLSALLLFCYNRRESQTAGEHADEALAALESLLAQERLAGDGSHGSEGQDGEGGEDILWDDPLAGTLAPDLNRGEREDETDPAWDSDEMRVVTITG